MILPSGWTRVVWVSNLVQAFAELSHPVSINALLTLARAGNPRLSGGR